MQRRPRGDGGHRARLLPRTGAAFRVLCVFTTLAGAILAGCGEGAPARASGGDLALFQQEPSDSLTLTMHDVRFDATVLEFPSGAVVVVALANAGTVEHDFTVDELEGAHGYRIEGDLPASVTESERDVHVRLRPGTTAELRLRIDEPGEYEFFCDVPGHRRAGMAGTISVR